MVPLVTLSDVTDIMAKKKCLKKVNRILTNIFSRIMIQIHKKMQQGNIGKLSSSLQNIYEISQIQNNIKKYNTGVKGKFSISVYAQCGLYHPR